MVFTPTNLFKGIPCPYAGQCSLTNCMFSHEVSPKQDPISETSTAQSTSSRILKSGTSEPPAKRRKVTYISASQKPPSRADRIRSELAAAREARTSTSLDENAAATSPSQPKSLTRAVSPPSSSITASGSNAGRAETGKPIVKSESGNGKQTADNDRAAVKSDSGNGEHLNPRLIANDPAGHGKRSLYLKHMHAEMVRLNQLVKVSQTLEYKNFLSLTDQELIKLALDEEEKMATEHPQLYANVVKQRIAFYKKMQVDDWAKQIEMSFKKATPQATNGKKDAKPIHTDLTPNEELLILPHLVADQSKLAPHGYIPTPPTEAQAAEASAAVEASRNYEVCDRCSARFQVFADRNEEGLLASNGPCRHHPNRKVSPPKTKGDVAMGSVKEAYHPCCNGVVGSPGCAEMEYHVFKAGTPARLAAVLPFINTPDNENPAKDRKGEKVKAVAFDCEMGYTVYGLELIRLTAVVWPSGGELLDVLVRPLGTIIDLNSRFSGVWPEHVSEAIPYHEWKSLPPTTAASPSSNQPLPIVASPQEARALLCSYLTPSTPLLGHAIENDLNAVRLCHPTIVDTILLFPHPRGLPMRFGLKMLSARHLGRSIQNGGERGHDSLEDAVATGDLARVKAGEKWKLLRATGWRIVNGELKTPDGVGSGNGEYVKAMVAKALDGAAGKKRRKTRPGAGGDESTEDEEVVPSGSGVAAYLNR